jgi:hypothetical protein
MDADGRGWTRMDADGIGGDRSLLIMAIAPGFFLFLLLALSNRFSQQVRCQTANRSAFFLCPFFQSFLNFLWQICGNSSP